MFVLFCFFSTALVLPHHENGGQRQWVHARRPTTPLACLSLVEDMVDAGGHPIEAPAVLPPVAMPLSVDEASAVVPSGEAPSRIKTNRNKQSGKKKVTAPSPEPLSPHAPVTPEPTRTTIENMSCPRSGGKKVPAGNMGNWAYR